MINVPLGTPWLNRKEPCESTGPYFVMTVDVDSWSSLLGFYSVVHDPSIADSQVNVDEGIRRLLELFEKHEVKATFFVPGDVAQKHSAVITEICQYGHEIACHGLVHKKDECLLNETKQKQMIEETTRIIRRESGWQPKGFRAPCLRANETTLDILNECGYVYDSSVVSTFVPGYYGFLMAPLKPYHPSPMFIERKGSLKILEIPVSVNPIIPLPLSAAWMRNLGSSWVKVGVKINFLLGNPVVFYVHPRDVVPLPKISGVPWHLYRNVGSPAIGMLDAIFAYAKGLGAKFIRAIDLARIMG